MPKRADITEAMIAKAMIEYLTVAGYECFQEVHLKHERGRADIIGKSADDPLRIHIVECKRAPNLDVLAQANVWRGHAHFVSLAFLAPKRWPELQLYQDICGMLGIGAYSVNTHLEVRQIVAPKLWRSADRLARGTAAQLLPEHKTYAAAGTSGKYWTTYKATCQQIAAAVAKQPGITLKQLVDSTGKMHYSSISNAKATLATRLRQGVVDGVRSEKVDGVLRLYLATAS